MCYHPLVSALVSDVGCLFTCGDLQSQLRQRLVSELRRLAESGDRRADPLTRGQRGQHPLSQDGSLFRQAADSLVAGHLRSGRYDYTLSVFMPECGLNDSKVTISLLETFQYTPLLLLINFISDFYFSYHC